MYGLQNRCSDDRARDALLGSLVLSYRRFTNFLLLHTHTHTHTHIHTHTHWHISFQTSCKFCLPFTTKALVWSLSIQCEISDGQSGISSALVFSCWCCILSFILIWHTAVTVKSGLKGGGAFRITRESEIPMGNSVMWVHARIITQNLVTAYWSLNTALNST
jgi:hypothetical protein